jgi:hypothetical protein
MRLRFAAPLLGLALTAVTMTAANAQAADPKAELVQLRQDHHYMHVDYTRIERELKKCETPDATDVANVQAAANDISRRAADLAPRLGGAQHVQVLGIQDVAEIDFWGLSHLQTPDVCYQPSA